MFHDRQIDPVKGRLIHADLTRLVKGQKIEVTVPLHLIGEPVGVKEKQGVLEQVIREIDVRCQPRDIPDSIDVDVSNLDVHDMLHVSDIKVSEGVEILTDADFVIATVGIVREEVAAAPGSRRRRACRAGSYRQGQEGRGRRRERVEDIADWRLPIADLSWQSVLLRA
jgi:large subunit ribosomal protein L25